MLSAYVWGTATWKCDPIFQLIEFLKFIKLLEIRVCTNAIESHYLESVGLVMLHHRTSPEV